MVIGANDTFFITRKTKNSESVTVPTTQHDFPHLGTNGQAPLGYSKGRVIIISSKKENYEQYMKEGGSNTGSYIMPLWNEQELQNANTGLVQFNYPEEEWKKRYFKWGPIPRYVLEKVSEAQQEELILAISKTNLNSCISSINQPDSPETGSHKVIHIDALPNSGYIKQIVRFGSIYIQEKIIQRFYWNWRETLIQKVKGSSNLSQLIGGITFEELAHQTLRFGGTFDIKSLEPTKPNPFKDTIVINPKGSASFLDLKDLKARKKSKKFINENMYARPEDIKFPSVDSFLGSYLFQMTVSLRHPVALAELNDLFFNLNKENNNNSQQYYLFYVVPPEIFQDFKAQNYMEIFKTTDKEGKTIPYKDIAKPENVPTCCHQFALKMEFSSIEPQYLYPVKDPEDSIINEKLSDELYDTTTTSTTIQKSTSP
eukprot:gene6691-8277_t